MKTALNFRKFNREKTIEELAYTISLWNTKLEFVEVELQFILKLIKSYPFSSEVSNLFERIQLFVKEINTLEKENTDLLESIKKYEAQLNNTSGDIDLGTADSYLSDFENLSAKVFKNTQRYRGFKRYIYEYITSIAL